jgi:hypothetical protein
MISADREFYKLALNGQYLGNFRHRLPLHLVEYLKVSGVCGIDHILIERDMSAYQQMNVNPYPQPAGGQNMGIGTSSYATPSAPYYPQQGPQMMVSCRLGLVGSSSDYSLPFRMCHFPRISPVDLHKHTLNSTESLTDTLKAAIKYC